MDIEIAAYTFYRQFATRRDFIKLKSILVSILLDSFMISLMYNEQVKQSTFKTLTAFMNIT